MTDKELLIKCAETGIYYKHYSTWNKSRVDMICHLSEDDLLIDLSNEKLICLNQMESEEGYLYDPELYYIDEFKIEDYGKEWSMNKEDLLDD